MDILREISWYFLTLLVPLNLVMAGLEVKDRKYVRAVYFVFLALTLGAMLVSADNSIG